MDEFDFSPLYVGATWNTLLAHSNEELKIDAEFTREGVQSLLGMVSELVKSSGSTTVQFEWK